MEMGGYVMLLKGIVRVLQKIVDYIIVCILFVRVKVSTGKIQIIS